MLTLYSYWRSSAAYRVRIGLQLKRLENESDAIAKWDGRLPQVTGGATPFVQIKP